MNWLLDVNALLAMAYERHNDHDRMMRWYASLAPSKSKLMTCAITEIGFIRVSLQAGFENDVREAIGTLHGLKQSSRIPFVMITDAIGAEKLPKFVSGPKQVTDGHLVTLASENNLRLATFDKAIPKSFQIP